VQQLANGGLIDEYLIVVTRLFWEQETTPSDVAINWSLEARF
jgi:hypothetical protein